MAVWRLGSKSEAVAGKTVRINVLVPSEAKGMRLANLDKPCNDLSLPGDRDSRLNFVTVPVRAVQMEKIVTMGKRKVLDCLIE